MKKIVQECLGNYEGVRRSVQRVIGMRMASVVYQMDSVKRLYLSDGKHLLLSTAVYIRG